MSAVGECVPTNVGGLVLSLGYLIAYTTSRLVAESEVVSVTRPTLASDLSG